MMHKIFFKKCVDLLPVQKMQIRDNLLKMEVIYRLESKKIILLVTLSTRMLNWARRDYANVTQMYYMSRARLDTNFDYTFEINF